MSLCVSCSETQPRSVLSNATTIQPPNAPLSRGLEVHPDGSGEDLEIWIDRSEFSGIVLLERFLE